VITRRAPFSCEIDVRIESNDADRIPPSQDASPEINQISLPVLDDNVLRLKIAVDQNPGQPARCFGISRNRGSTASSLRFDSSILKYRLRQLSKKYFCSSGKAQR